MVTKAEAQAARDRQKQQGTGTAAPASGAYTLLRDLRPNLQSNDIVRDLIPRRAFGEGTPMLAAARPRSSRIC